MASKLSSTCSFLIFQSNPTIDTSESKAAHRALVSGVGFGVSMTDTTPMHALVVQSYIASKFTDWISFNAVSILAFNNGDFKFTIYEH